MWAAHKNLWMKLLMSFLNQYCMGCPHYFVDQIIPGLSLQFCFILFVLFAIFILHSRESELYRYTLDGKSALAWELPFWRFMGHLSST